MHVLAHAFNATGPRAWLLWLGLAVLLAGALRIAGVGRSRVPEWAGVLGVVSGIALAALGNVHTEPAGPAVRPDTSGSVRILTPRDGDTIEGGDTPVEIEVADFVVAEGATRAARSGYGHLHLMLDGVLVPLAPSAGSGGHTVCVPAGRHTVTAVLVAEDHFGFANEAEVTDSVDVRARTGRC